MPLQHLVEGGEIFIGKACAAFGDCFKNVLFGVIGCESELTVCADPFTLP